MIMRLGQARQLDTLAAEVAALTARIEGERDSAASRLLDAQREWLAIAREQQEASRGAQEDRELLRSIDERLRRLERQNDETREALDRATRESEDTRRRLEDGERKRERLDMSLVKLEKRLQQHADDADRAAIALAERIEATAR